MAVERVPITDRAQWLEWRRADATASDIGAIAGVNPYKSRLKCHLEKRGVVFNSADSLAMRRGRWLEPAVALAVAELKPEWSVVKANEYCRDPEFRLGATPDFYLHNDPRGDAILQTKTVAPQVFLRQWDDGREVPLWITLQTLTEAMLADAAFGVVAALVVDPFHMDVKIIEIPRHAAAEQRIREMVKVFWREVDEGREPKADYAADGEAIAALIGASKPGCVFDASGNNRLPEILARRSALKAAVKAAEADCEEIDNEIKLMLGDAEAVTGLPGWSISFKSGMRAGFTVEPKLQRVLRVTDRRPLEEQPQ